MAHKSRSSRSANIARRKAAAHRQKPLPLAEQLRRAAERQAAHEKRYPDAPKYRYSYAHAKPVQPLCYQRML